MLIIFVVVYFRSEVFSLFIGILFYILNNQIVFNSSLISFTIHNYPSPHVRATRGWSFFTWDLLASRSAVRSLPHAPPLNAPPSHARRLPTRISWLGDQWSVRAHVMHGSWRAPFRDESPTTARREPPQCGMTGEHMGKTRALGKNRGAAGQECV